MEEQIRNYILELGVDDAGFACAEDYKSPKSYEISRLLPDAKSIIVMAFKPLSSCESPSMSAAQNGYLDLGAFARSASYRIARFLENKYNAKVATIPVSYPFELHNDRRAIADFSLRHAAVAAGLGAFGRHNLVIHPRFGTRVIFTSIITNLALEPSPQTSQDFCIHCNLCVENCPVRALNEEGKTDVMKCFGHSQPYGLTGDIAFQLQLLGSSAEEQKKLLMDEQYARLRQAAHLGNQYMCFNCLKICPVGLSPE
ncbi:MAG TPA: 4Fe-4S double cluster binding domain-containing protein [Methylomusa anaerophila]|uniref:Epoxyqueuosine reductase n=1 Tax=Methylomusa anaerophila TaxID=1930071 RepID=A0A348AGH7_9FIRM|nr:4Fe-4S binding protein [Methylomusa anaerophila]BBB90175.1 epoxyqueuosine reductase [Methylomusa anaerophila]HML88099.1 4Fe-4S double cluster binding domain-containing protein [Methylomusa anaerophila]